MSTFMALNGQLVRPEVEVSAAQADTKRVKLGFSRANSDLARKMLKGISSIKVESYDPNAGTIVVSGPAYKINEVRDKFKGKEFLLNNISADGSSQEDRVPTKQKVTLRVSGQNLQQVMRIFKMQYDNVQQQGNMVSLETSFPKTVLISLKETDPSAKILAVTPVRASISAASGIDDWDAKVESKYLALKKQVETLAAQMDAEKDPGKRYAVTSKFIPLNDKLDKMAAQRFMAEKTGKLKLSSISAALGGKYNDLKQWQTEAKRRGFKIDEGTGAEGDFGTWYARDSFGNRVGKFVPGKGGDLPTEASISAAAPMMKAFKYNFTDSKTAQYFIKQVAANVAGRSLANKAKVTGPIVVIQPVTPADYSMLGNFARTVVKQYAPGDVEAAAGDAPNPMNLRYIFPSEQAASDFTDAIYRQGKGLKAAYKGRAAVVLNPGTYATIVSDTARKMGGKPPAAASISAAQQAFAFIDLGGKYQTASKLQQAAKAAGIIVKQQLFPDGVDVTLKGDKAAIQRITNQLGIDDASISWS